MAITMTFRPCLIPAQIPSYIIPVNLIAQDHHPFVERLGHYEQDQYRDSNEFHSGEISNRKKNIETILSWQQVIIIILIL
jgi:hypothetical protein